MQREGFLNVGNHPQMLFRSTIADNLGYLMKGDLTIKGTTAPVTPRPRTTDRRSSLSTGSIHAPRLPGDGRHQSSGYGVGTGVDILSDDITLTLNAQFIEPAPEG